MTTRKKGNKKEKGQLAEKVNLLIIMAGLDKNIRMKYLSIMSLQTMHTKIIK